MAGCTKGYGRRRRMRSVGSPLSYVVAPPTCGNGGGPQRDMYSPGVRRAEGDRKVTVYRKVKDSIVTETPMTTFSIAEDAESNVHLGRAVLDAATDAGTAQILELGVENFPCCAKCSGMEYREPTDASFAGRSVSIRSPMEIIQSGYGTCAEIAVYNAAVTNAKLITGKGVRSATAELIPDAQGPGRHHAVMVDDLGKVVDPVELLDKDRPCTLCS